MKRILSLVIVVGLAALSACGKADDKTTYPTSDNVSSTGKHRDAGRGTLTGEGGFSLFGGDKKDEGSANIGVNGFLWRATLDTVSFMPIASADPFGGVVITDWYEDPKTPGERYKINAFILDRNLRADAIKIKLFKQIKGKNGSWSDAATTPKMGRDIEDTILTRARQLKVTQLEGK